VRDPGHEDELLVVVDGIDDAVVADADSIVIPPCQLLSSVRPRVVRK
jgi:hypothetical protein